MASKSRFFIVSISGQSLLITLADPLATRMHSIGELSPHLNTKL